MPIYRVLEPRLGGPHMREWRRRLLHTVGLLGGTLAVCAIGLIALDSSHELLTAKVSRGLWNALNLVQREKLFMMVTMVAFLMIGGYSLSSLTGFLSSEAVITRRENKTMGHTLDHLTNHVIVIGFGILGRLVADRLHQAGEQVVVIER